MSIGSLPRLRLYTSLSQYLQVGWGYLSGTWNRGRNVTTTEIAIAKHVGAKHAILTSMARVGIYLTVKNIITPGQKVIMSPYTIADVVNMVVSAGGVPLFADLDADTCNLNADRVAQLLETQKDVGAVMVTHFYGLACDVVEIQALCARYDIPMIEDAAQAFGVTVDGQSTGTFGLAGIFSFGLYKNVNAFYGGAVVTNNDNLAQALRARVNELPKIRTSFYLKKVISGAIIDFLTWPAIFRIFTFQIFRYGILHNVDRINNKLKIDTNPKLMHEVPSDYLCQPSDLQARLIRQQLPMVRERTDQRRRNAARYRAGLSKIPQLRLPPAVLDGNHMYWYFPIQYDHREDLVKYAMLHNRDITLSYHRNCAALPCFAEFEQQCPNAERTASSVIYLPTYPGYAEEEIDKTVAVIQRFFTPS
jgi:perosamine synthetase